MNAVAIEERHAVQAGIEGRGRVLERRLVQLTEGGATLAGALLAELKEIQSLKPRARIGSALRFRDGGALAAMSPKALETAQRRLADLERRVALITIPPPRTTLTPLPTPAHLREPDPEPETERRGEWRARLETAVTLDSGSNFFIGFTRNISRGGIFVTCEDPLPQNTEIELLFSLPGGRRIEAVAAVSWVRERAACGPEVPPGMGLRFVRLAEADRRTIRTFMRLREPLFYPD